MKREELAAALTALGASGVAVDKFYGMSMVTCDVEGERVRIIVRDDPKEEADLFNLVLQLKQRVEVVAEGSSRRRTRAASEPKDEE